MSKFSWPIRVYHEDVDIMKIVYYANYLRFYERARTEHLRAVGFDQSDLMKNSGVMFVVKTVMLDYQQPARLNNMLLVTSETTSFRRSSFLFEQKIYRDNEQGICLNKATVTIVCVDTVSLKPCPIPEVILQKLNVEEEKF